MKPNLFFAIALTTSLWFIGCGLVGPNPQMVTKGGDDFGSEIFDYGYRVYGTVVNNGNEGMVTVEADLIQGANKWTKSVSFNMKKEEVKEFEIQFLEPTLTGGASVYKLRFK